MKKLLILLVILSGCAKTPTYISKPRSASVALSNINVGSVPNDGTGDKLRDAMIKINNNNNTIESFATTLSTTTEMRTTIADSNNARLAAALDIADYALMQSDTNTAGGAMTYNGVINYVASQGGGSGGFEWTPFIVGTTTGAPTNGDTAVTINQMAGDRIEVYRGTTADMPLQWLNETATNGKTGYRYNSSGTIVVRPAWATGNRAIIKAYPSAAVSKDTLTGGAVSSLLTDLRSYWPMNETTGTTVGDYKNLANGTTTASPTSSSKFGYARAFVRAESDGGTFGTTVGDVGTSDFTIACWVYVPDTAKVNYGIMGNWGSTPNYYLHINEFSYKALFYWDFGVTPVEITSNAVIPQGAWTHIAVVCDRSASITMYINGTAQTDVESIAADAAVAGNNSNVFNIGNVGSNHSGYHFGGTIDDPAIWLRVLTQGEITSLQTAAVN